MSPELRNTTKRVLEKTRSVFEAFITKMKTKKASTEGTENLVPPSLPQDGYPAPFCRDEVFADPPAGEGGYCNQHSGLYQHAEVMQFSFPRPQ